MSADVANKVLKSDILTVDTRDPLELLRRTAEHCLRDMVQHLFTRLPQFVDDTRVIPNMKVSV